jgi:serine/threonine-protein kinase
MRPWNVARCPRCASGADDASLFTDIFRRARTGVLADRYRIQDTLHSGRVTTIYRATDLADPNRTYAIKELSPMTLIRPEERREAEAALQRAVERWAALDHPSLARVVDHVEDQERQYVVCEYAPGWSGERIIGEPNVRVTPELARNWGAQLCDLLTYLHSRPQPLYVPFLAPGHIVVAPDGRVRLVGLGLGQIYSPGLYGPHGSITGYAAPELAEQFPDPQTDLFALGRLLYALLIDRLLEKGLARPLPLQQAVPEAPTQLVQAIARAAGRRRERRYASAADMREALWDAVQGALQPIEDWYSQARVAPGEAAQQVARARAGRGSMEDLGFARDPRFGRPPEPPPAAPALRERPQARLSVQPHEFNLRDLPAEGRKRLVLTVRNTGEGDLTFRLVRYAEWLRAPEREVTLAPGKEARAIVSLDPARLAGGRSYEPRALAVDSSVGRQWIGIRAEIATAPVLLLERDSLDFGRIEDDAARSLPLAIRNGGRQLLTGQCVARAPWLQVSPTEFRVGPGNQMQLDVRILPDRLPNGPQQAQEALLLDSNGGQARIAAQAWRPRPRLHVGAAQLDFGHASEGQVVERTLLVSNAGDGPLQGAARSLLPWMQPYPERWTCEPGESLQLRIVCDCAGLADGPIHVPQALRLQTNGGVASLALDMQISAPRMVIETPLLDLGRVMRGERAQSELAIHNAGSAPLEALATPAVPWLSVAEESVVCAPGEIRRIQVVADTSAFERGIRLDVPAGLRLAAGSDVQTVPARLVVIQPDLRVEPERVDFGYVDPAEPARQTITLHNDGTGALAWHAQTDAEWVEIAPSTGVCPEGGQAAIVLTAYALALEAGRSEATATLAISSDGGRIKLPLHLALAAPRLEVDRTFVDLGVSVNRRDTEASIRVFNRGLGLLRGVVKSDRLWLVIDRASFECEMGHSVELGIHTDMDEFADPLSEDRGVIQIESNGGLLEVDTRLQTALVAELAEPEPVTMSAGDEDHPPQGRLMLRNIGMATARVALRPAVPELAVSREQLEVKPGKSVRVTLRWQGILPPLTAETAIEVHSGETALRVPVYLPTGRP